MIKATDLRLGNWIMEGPSPNQVYSIDQGGVSFFKINDQRVNKMGEDIRFRPIPLTPEILEKAGFEKEVRTGGGFGGTDSEIVYHKKGIDIYDNHDSGGSFAYATYTRYHGKGFKSGFTIYSVHQLQNLFFTLTGTELNITL